jgi:alpha-beta hydrolase superfamily lysophospholipase
MNRILKLILASGVAGIAAYSLLRQRSLRDLPAPRPAFDYLGAEVRVAGLQVGDSERVNPVCRTTLLSHGQPTDKAIALLHGYTNCPHQYHLLAQSLFERGHNVLIPRLPHHGMADRLAPDMQNLTAEQLVELTSETADILHGLGRQTLLVGFSVGGLLATWAAQHRGDLDKVVLVAPALALKSIPLAQRRIYANLFLMLPNQFRWWDPTLQDAIVGPAHAYPRFATRAIAQILRLMLLVEQRASQQPFAARRVTVITNPCDDVVDNRGIERVVAHWRTLGTPVTTYELPASWKLIHDIIDPQQEQQQIDRVYPQLLKWIEE